MKKSFLILTAMLIACTISAQSVAWVETMGGSIRDQGQNIAADDDGNVFNVGIFRNTADFGGTSLTADSSSIYIQKLSPAGAVLWAKEICPTGVSNSKQGVTVDAFGDVIIVGRFNGTVDFDPIGVGGNLTAAVTPDYDFNTFILKLDSDGNFIWVKSVAGNTGDDVEVDPDGNIYVLGRFEGTVDFDPALGSSFNLTYSNDHESPFILKLTDDGDFLWAVKSDSLGHQITEDIAVNSAGHVISVGVFRGIVDFDPSDVGISTLSGIPTALTSFHDSFVQELDENGNFVDLKHIPGDFSGATITATNWTSGVAVDAADNYYITGKFSGLIDFNFIDAPGTVLVDAGLNAFTFIQSYNSSGTLNWTRDIATSEPTIRIDNSIACIGNLVTVTGLFQNTVDFDPDPIDVFNIASPLGEIANAFVLTLNNTGDFVWARNFTFNTFIKDVIGDDFGNIYTTGIFHLTPDFDPFDGGLVVSSAGGGDIFVQKFEAAVAAPDVVATTPNLTVCCTGDSIALGTEWIPTGNIYGTFGNFTPTDGWFDAKVDIGGQFIDLPPCVTFRTFPEPLDSLGFYLFEPCECGPGEYPIIYSYTDRETGLSDQDTMIITVEEPPAVEFEDLTISLCNYVTAVPLTPIIEPGATCEITGDWVLDGNFFDALAAGIGTHDIEITCTAVDGCTTTIIGTVIVTEEELWHNTTSSAVVFPLSTAGDQGTDIYTDESGYVYATGLYLQETTFEDLSGNSITIPGTIKGERFYMTCYNDCGMLEWVIYDDANVANHYSKGFGIGKSKDEIFVGLNYYTQAHFNTVYPDGTVFDNPFTLNGSYAFGNIGIVAIDGEDSGTFGHVNATNDRLDGYIGQALYADAENDDIVKGVYVCGSSDLNEDYIPSVAYAKVNYDRSANSITNIWERSSINQRESLVANDLTGKIKDNEIWLAGTFAKELTLLSSAGTSETASSVGITDAFYTAIDAESGYMITDIGIRTFVADTDEMAEATSVSGDERYFYVGGNYFTKSGTVFQAALSASSFDQSEHINGYIYAYAIESREARIESIWNLDSDINLTGLDDNGSQLMFFGNYLEGTPLTSSGGLDVMNYSDMGQRNLFMGDIDMMSTNWHLPKLQNSTLNSRAGDHISTKVTIGNNEYAYYTGIYTGVMSYFAGSPISGDLNATGSSPLVTNAFYLRQSTVTRQLRSPIVDNISIEENAFVSIYPNPTNGQVRINIENYDTDEIVTLKVYNEIGEIIYSDQFSASGTSIDLSSFEKGVYILQTTFKLTTETRRIIKL